MTTALLCSAFVLLNQTPESPAPGELTTQLALRSTVTGTTASGLVSFQGGVIVEHRLGELSSIGAAVDVAFRASDGGAISGGAADFFTVSLEPMIRRWITRPLDGVFLGFALPVSYARALTGATFLSLQGGGYAQLGYSFVFGRGFVIQAAVGPGVSVAFTRTLFGSLGALGSAGGLSASSEMTTWSAGLRSTVSFGYAF